MIGGSNPPKRTKFPLDKVIEMKYILALALAVVPFATSAQTIAEKTLEQSVTQCGSQKGEVVNQKVQGKLSRVECSLPDGSTTVFTAVLGIYFVDADADGKKAACALTGSKLVRNEDGSTKCVTKTPHRLIDTFK